MILVKQAEIYAAAKNNAQHARLDVRCRDDKVIEIGSSLKPEPGESVFEADGGLLLPGLHDHHIHLMALAAALQSVHCGPPHITSASSLADTLQNSNGDGWIRGFGYHECVAGLLHRKQLDELVPERPLRIQHRSGKMWFVNSAAARILNLDENRTLNGIECDRDGSPTGRLFRLDNWLRKQLGNESLPDIKFASQKLASLGVTGITDVTPDNSIATEQLFLSQIEAGNLLQRVRLMGNETLRPGKHRLLETGSLKIMLDEYELPDFDEFKQRIVLAHQQKRSVAIHCVTTPELVFALSALSDTGSEADRIEHASLSRDDTIQLMCDTGITVVTQPNFISERGDQYLQDIGPEAHHHLYRIRSLLDAGIPIAAGTDAPFGDPDPWRAMQAATDRRTQTGKLLGEQEMLTPEQALRLFITTAEDPGGPARSVSVGADADLCLLNKPWRQVRTEFSAQNVALTVRAAEVIYQRESGESGLFQ